jgi:hypothetical protein
MKSQLLLSCLLTLATAPAWCTGSPGSLPAWDQLTPAQREVVIAPIRERWTADPQLRVRLFEHALRWQQLSPDQRARMRRGMGRWEHMAPEQRDAMRALFHKMRTMTPDQRQALRRQLEEFQ